MRYLLILALSFSVARAQDTLYARKAIKFLTSKKCYGRGYLNNGLENAAAYIGGELKKTGVRPLFEKTYYQPFAFSVNTFPSKMSLTLNGKQLEPGKDFIPRPESGSMKGEFKMRKKDSVTYVSENEGLPLVLTVKRKLTFSVATRAVPYCEMELLEKNIPEKIVTARVDVKNEFLTSFGNNNVCGYIDGRQSNDTMVVFSAHYDHLGGIGKKTFFPGANDNASGVSVLLNLAKFYMKNPPRYKTVFIFFAGEEAGLIGSKYFVANKTVDLKKIKFLLNFDLLGTGDDGIMLVNGAVHTKEFELMKKINGEQTLVKEIRKRGKAQNSDHYWFTEAGVPAFFIYTLGGTTSYHDVFDVAKQLPLTDYVDVFKLITEFVQRL